MQTIVDRVRFPLFGFFHSLFPRRIYSRKMLPFYLNRHALVGRGVEIGVQCGLFSEHILRYWKGERLICVDPWMPFDPTDYVEKVDNVSAGKHESYFADTTARLRPFAKRAQILRLTSKAAAATIPDGSLDFVYIDAQHHYSAVKEDIELWWPKLTRKGLLCGHDWLLDYGPPKFGVKKAVLEFAKKSGLEVAVSRDNVSWFVHRDGSVFV